MKKCEREGHIAHTRFSRKRSRRVIEENEADKQQAQTEPQKTEAGQLKNEAEETKQEPAETNSAETQSMDAEDATDKALDERLPKLSPDMSGVTASAAHMTLPLTIECGEDSPTSSDNSQMSDGLHSAQHQHDVNNNSHQHDVNNNSTDFENTHQEAIVEMVNVEGNTVSAVGSGDQHQHACIVQLKGCHAAEQESSVDNEDSLGSCGAGDTVVRTNLYGTDVDQESCQAESITQENQAVTTAPSQHDMESLYDPGNVPQPRHPRHILVDQPSSQYETQEAESVALGNAGQGSAYPDQRGRGQHYEGHEETNMSVSNHVTDTDQYKATEKLTGFGGVFKQTTTELPENNNERAFPVNQPYSAQLDGNQQASSGQQGYLTPSRFMAATPSQAARAGMEDCQMAAEQLASELVKKFGGPNSHMISDILKQEEGDQQFVCEGFERQSQEELAPYAVCSQTQLHDVDLLNTPQQLAVEDVLYQHQTRGYVPQPAIPGLTKSATFGSPQACSTPGRLRKNYEALHTPQNLQGSLTYNDIQLHGSKWSSTKDAGRNDPAGIIECSENPCPELQQHTRHPHMYPNYRHGSEFQSPDINRPWTNGNHMGPKSIPSPSVDLHPFNTRQHGQCKKDFAPNLPFYGQSHAGMFSAVRSPSVMPGSTEYPRQQAEDITKMTFIHREMETHLSHNHPYQRPTATATQQASHNHHYQRPTATATQHSMSDMDYSSIYPRREFIEKTAGMKVPIDMSQTGGSYDHNPPPKKRHRMSRFSSPQARMPQDDGPPNMPIIDDMIAKYPPTLQREHDSSSQKYFVVNPSDATSMSSKTLLCKYIDFLVLENEQITEISKSVAPPVDIYVTEDMYFMDSLKYRVPFPSKKFTEWVSSFYPKLNFWEMNFKGLKPKAPSENQLKMVDSRQTQQILEDTFYFFQREVMSNEEV